MRQLQALRIMMSGRSVFLTGAPGAGKTFLLNQFIKLAKQAGRNVAITASTGIAATHIGGSTIHSWSGLGIKDVLSTYDLEKLKNNARLIKRYNQTDVLVIDEVSMLHGARLDMVNMVAKLLRQNGEPFGGLQVILVGDLFQLPPVSRERGMADFVQLSSAWAELDPQICYLTEQHRQSMGDQLLDLLGAMRRGDVNEFHEMALRERMRHDPLDDEIITKLYAHNADVDSVNLKHLADIQSDARRYTMTFGGRKNKQEQLVRGVLAPEVLELKRGAEVMFVANSSTRQFVNGTRGVVIDFVSNMPVVVTARGQEIKVEPHTWSVEEDGRVVAEAAQLPLRLAWAITIHKSQGMSLDAAEIDLSRSFTPGMGYVALSRVRSMDGIFLKGVNNMALAMHPLIFDFDGDIQRQSAILADSIDDYEPESAKQSTEQAIDPLLFDELRQWRLDTARRDGVAPFMVLHDKTLNELATRKPQTEQALKGITGLGPAKIGNYGTAILRIINK